MLKFVTKPLLHIKFVDGKLIYIYIYIFIYLFINLHTYVCMYVCVCKYNILLPETQQ